MANACHAAVGNVLIGGCYRHDLDQGEPIKLTFTTCDASQCYAQADISNAILDRLKSGHEVSYTGTDESGDTLQVPVSLSGFKEALDGPAMPVDAYNAEMKKIAETILSVRLGEGKSSTGDAVLLSQGRCRYSPLCSGFALVSLTQPPEFPCGGPSLQLSPFFAGESRRTVEGV